VYANRVTRVSQLAKGKMIDLQYEVRREGTTENIETKQGNFSEEGFSEITWEAEIQPIEIPDQVKEELLGKVNAQLFGGAQSQGALKGNAAFSAKLPKLIGCVPQMINRIGKKVRRIILVVKFDFNGREQTLTLTHYVVDRSKRNFNLFGAGKSGADSATGPNGGGTRQQ